MTPAPIHPAGWNRSRLGAAVIAFFILQVGLLWIVGARPSGPAFATTPGFVWRLAPPELSQPVLPDWLWAADPTLFVLAGPNGFSGGAWMNLPAGDYELPGFDEPPRWLPLNPDWLNSSFQQFTLRDDLAARAPDDRSRRLESTEILLPPIQISARSVLRMDDNLKVRLADSPPVLPFWPTNDVIQSSVVQIAVDGTGSVISARLLRINEADGGLASSRIRSAEADRWALQFANGLRFRPVNSGPDASGFIWGKLTFEWATVEAIPASPNAISRPLP